MLASFILWPFISLSCLSTAPPAFRELRQTCSFTAEFYIILGTCIKIYFVPLIKILESQVGKQFKVIYSSFRAGLSDILLSSQFFHPHFQAEKNLFLLGICDYWKCLLCLFETKFLPVSINWWWATFKG
jgi:hypothetical protein